MSEPQPARARREPRRPCLEMIAAAARADCRAERRDCASRPGSAPITACDRAIGILNAGTPLGGVGSSLGCGDSSARLIRSVVPCGGRRVQALHSEGSYVPLPGAGGVSRAGSRSRRGRDAAALGLLVVVAGDPQASRGDQHVVGAQAAGPGRVEVQQRRCRATGPPCRERRCRRCPGSRSRWGSATSARGRRSRPCWRRRPSRTASRSRCS